jgi:hypothetical protein
MFGCSVTKLAAAKSRGAPISSFSTALTHVFGVDLRHEGLPADLGLI